MHIDLTNWWRRSITLRLRHKGSRTVKPFVIGVILSLSYCPFWLCFAVGERNNHTTIYEWRLRGGWLRSVIGPKAPPVPPPSPMHINCRCAVVPIKGEF